MATGQDWSRLEVEACVSDYLRMLTLELNGQTYSKADHASSLMTQLEGRSRKSIDFKHCNISAVMLQLGYPYIRGYKPLANYQGLLFEAVEDRLLGNRSVDLAVEAAVGRPAAEIDMPVMDMVWVDPPRAPKRPAEPWQPTFRHLVRDYLAQEARNRSLGQAGELFVAEFETRRLDAAGKKSLAARVEHVAATMGDGLGFDVLSFDLDGRERLIEVKTTSFGELTPFFVSRNELARSEADREQYHLYRLFDFRHQPRLFGLQGAISELCSLDPVSYLARVA